jgi:hypothetical protein
MFRLCFGVLSHVINCLERLPHLILYLDVLVMNLGPEIKCIWLIVVAVLFANLHEKYL